MFDIKYFLVTRSIIGRISEQQTYQLRFHCGICSNENTKIYHNVLGQHNHLSADKILDFKSNKGGES